VKASGESSYSTTILADGISLAACLLLVRSQLAHFLSFRSVRSAATVPLRAGLAGLYDFAYVAAITVAFVAAAWLLRRRPALGRVLHAAFLVIAVFSLLLALVNVPIVQVLGSPLTYQWLYYSDFLRAQDARNAVVEGLTWRRLLIAAAVTALFFVLRRPASSALELARRRFGSRTVAVVACALLLAYFPLAGSQVGRAGWDRYRLRNSVLVFARSLISANRSPSLLALRTRMGSEDFEPDRAAPRPGGVPSAAGASAPNVLIVVLESVAAEYLQPYGSRYPATPTLETLRSDAALFENIYAQSPSTTSSLASLLLSIYPSITQREFIRERPDLIFPSLSSELRKAGYRTAYFGSSDQRFMSIGTFLSHRGFDAVRDYRSFPCDRSVLRGSTPNWPLLDGIDDECTAEALLRWIGEAPGRPFFAMFWTMMTHYPYFAEPPSIDFGVKDPYFNRYLNALRHDDGVIAKLVRFLQQRGLDRSTLMVVVGDHGEAFGRHGHRGHGTDVYEENVHVPLLLIQPGRFRGERYSEPGGIVDVAPTILDMLGIDRPAAWQGRSLWSSIRNRRAYFAVWFSDFRLGYREGDRKFIYDAAEDRFELYDLRRDPHETINRADEEPSRLAEAKERLAGWVQYQDRMMQRLLAKGSPSVASDGRRSRP